jgi:hypothetical protein
MKRAKTGIILAASISLFTAACGKFGQVGQGAVVAYDRNTGVMTVIEDSDGGRTGKPRYDKLPAVAVAIPEDRGEMGPEPIPGGLLALDTANNRAIVYDGGTIRAIPYTPVDQRSGVAPGNPDAAKCPVVDRENGTIRVYSRREGKLVTFTVAAEYLALPAGVWREGEEVRYYYKTPGRALRLMNVTRAEEK